MKTAISALSILISVTSLTAQPFKNLVFEGAGARGLAYAGAIMELEDAGIMKEIEKVGGTSAGAIAAMAVALGYSGEEIRKLVADLKLQRFNDGRFLFIGGIARVNKHFGWYRGNAFNRWLGEVIRTKTGDPEITFEQLKRKGYKELFVTGTSLTEQRLVIFSADTYPRMKIRDAVRISMSIPLYFEAVCIDSIGNVIDCRSGKNDVNLLVDGGITGNFPIALFDTLNPAGERVANPLTIGLRIDNPEQIGYDKLQKGLAPFAIPRFRNYLGAFYNYTIENLNRHDLTNDDWRRTVSISCGHVGPKIKKLSDTEKTTLVENGRAAVREFLRM